MTRLSSLYACSVVSASLRPHGLQPAQAPVLLQFSRQAYWNRLPFPPPGDLPNPGIESVSPMSPALADPYHRATWETFK